MGRARGGRASPGAVVVLPFRRDRLPRVAVIHAPSGWRPCHSGLAGSPPGALLTPTRGGHDGMKLTSAVRVQQRAASKRTGSIPALEDPRTLRRPGFIARPQPAVVEERGSDALPIDGMETVCARFLLRLEDRLEKRRCVWNVGILSVEPDYNSPDCQHSVTPPFCFRHPGASGAAAPTPGQGGARERETVGSAAAGTAWLNRSPSAPPCPGVSLRSLPG